jgi:holo-[acyl-carrier protein] synthase
MVSADRELDLELVMAVIGVGIDLVEVREAHRLLERWGDRLMNRVLTDAERAYVTRYDKPARYLAVRLAAKEAVYKALQSLPEAAAIGWREIEVERAQGGRPSIRLHGRAARIAAANGDPRILVSLTHTETTAGAVAVVEID